MSSRQFYYASLALRILEKILGSKFSVSGIEKLPKQPIMFVANHFTRAETFFIPYLIYKETGRQVRCLADSGLYVGKLGKFLESVGTVSTRDPNRDSIILRDLISGQYDWMIYPEGSMVKSKETRHEEVFVNYTPYRVGPVRTGSAVLALKSQLYRADLIDAFQNKRDDLLSEFEKSLGIVYEEHLKELNSYVVPVNITYYPIRPGANKIQKLASYLVKKIPKQIAEELEIEGNLLLGAEINIHFGDPINLANYVKNTRELVYQIPIIRDETKTNLILRYFKSRLTNEFMAKIYSDIQINLDHIFSSSLRHFSENEIEIGRLKRVIYLSAVMIKKTGKHRLNASVFEENLIKLFIDEPYHEFESAFELAKKQGLIEQIDSEKIRIKTALFTKKFDFHEIRLENTLQVIANEFTLLDVADNIVKRNCKIPDDELRRKVFTEIYKRDLEIFNSDYAINFDKDFSKDKSIGMPFFLDSKAKVSSKVRRVGVVLSHGYKSTPREVEALAKFLNGFGFKVYVVRLRGHGTAPTDLKNTTWQEWYDSVQRGYAAIQNISSRIVLIGFSTGGLLALLSAANKKDFSKKLIGVITINAALKLLDLRARMVPGINLWNEMLEKFHIEKGRYEYVDDKPENPAINYSRNYIKSVNELGKLMENCEKNLSNVLTNSLVIQADKDPVVNPVSGKMIYEKIAAQQKFLSELNFSNHVIINGQRKEEVFEKIREFFAKLKLI